MNSAKPRSHLGLERCFLAQQMTGPGLGGMAQLKRAKLYKNPFLMAENTWVTGKYLSNWIISSGRGENRKYQLVGGWVSHPLKNIWIKMGKNLPQFSGWTSKIFELPPFSYKLAENTWVSLGLFHPFLMELLHLTWRGDFHFFGLFSPIPDHFLCVKNLQARNYMFHELTLPQTWQHWIS